MPQRRLARRRSQRPSPSIPRSACPWRTARSAADRITGSLGGLDLGLEPLDDGRSRDAAAPLRRGRVARPEAGVLLASDAASVLGRSGLQCGTRGGGEQLIARSCHSRNGVARRPAPNVSMSSSSARACSRSSHSGGSRASACCFSRRPASPGRTRRGRRSAWRRCRRPIGGGLPWTIAMAARRRCGPSGFYRCASTAAPWRRFGLSADAEPVEQRCANSVYVLATNIDGQRVVMARLSNLASAASGSSSRRSRRPSRVAIFIVMSLNATAARRMVGAQRREPRPGHR